MDAEKSELVARLRKLHEQGYPPVSALEEAADRIAELEAALERAANALQKAGEMYAEQDARDALTSEPQKASHLAASVST